MWRLIKETWRRAQRVQQSKWFHIGASVVALIASIVLFGALLHTSYDLESQFTALEEALSGQNYNSQDEYAQALRDAGTVTVNGRTYGGDELLPFVDQFFDSQGNIAEPRALASLLLYPQIPDWAPRWLLDQPGTTLMLGIIVTIWMLLIIWMDLTAQLIVTTVGTAIGVWLARAAGQYELAWAIGGLGILTFSFVMLTRTLLALLDVSIIGRFVLGFFFGVIAGFWVTMITAWLISRVLASMGIQFESHIIGFIALGLGLLSGVAVIIRCLLVPPDQILAVAHTVVKEASRTRLSLVFIVLLLIVLPLIPMWLDPQAPLRFRVQTFMSQSINITYVAAAGLTLVLSCATIAFEVRDRQIWQLVSKPMSRMQYLIGKWIGVLGVNAVLITIAGLSIFMYLQYLRTLPVAPGLEGQLDRVQLRDAVLTARKSTRPSYDTLTSEQLRVRIDQEIAGSPELALQEETPEMRREVGNFIQQAYNAGQRVIPPGMARTYKFENLGPARNRTSSLVLRYRFHILEDSTHTVYRAAFLFNDQQPWIPREYVPDTSHDFLIGPDLIREDGTLTIRIVNLYEAPPNSPYGSLNFEMDDFELLYQVANFEGNFCRALLVLFTKLSFIATLGILFSTFLSFPVALLAAFTVFIAGSLAPFLATSLAEFRPPPIFQMDSFTAGQFIEWFFKSIVRWIGYAIVFVMSGFGETSPTASLVQGKYIPWSVVAWSIAKLVGIWSVITFVVGYLIMRSRELATYSGHG